MDGRNWPTSGEEAARRYYQVTGDGMAALADILEDAGSDVRFGALLGRPV